MRINKHKLIIIGGPTASGKTRLAISFAKENDGEIINADSVQVYKGLDIGTNKGDIQQIVDSKQQTALGHEFEIMGFEIENSGVTGWLFDLVEPDFDFTVAHYQQLASFVINDIVSRRKVPIIVGGTGLYIDALLKGYNFEGQRDKELREELGAMNLEQLREKLTESGFDLELLNNSDRNNPRRLVRLIEKEKVCPERSRMEKRKKEKKSSITHTANQLSSQSPSLKDSYDVTFYYPKYNREELMKTINKRAKEMIEHGLIDEVQKLLDKGYSKDLKSMQATGYKQVIDFLEGKIKNKENLIDAIALAHRQYAKRQITWFEGEGRGYELKFV